MAATLAGLAFVATPTQAARPTVAEQIQHYLECLDWMFNDPARHAIECAPGHVYIIPDPKSEGIDECLDYLPSAYVPVGRYEDCRPPCLERMGYVGVTYDGCYDPCDLQQQGTLTIAPPPELWMLMPVGIEQECPVIAPLAPNELRLFEI